MADGSATLSAAPAGGSFLIEPVGAHRIFTVEDLSEEQRAMALEASRFIEKEVIPKERHLESKEGKAAKDMVKVLKKACRQGFAQVEVPEKFGGLGADKVTSLLIADKLGSSGDFCVTWGAHSGIGMAPILYFGTDAQKHKYIPKIAGGDVTSCYALSEPGSGSDALAARTTAVLNPEGTHYILNGTKQWITNAAWMDVGVVFAKVDGDKFTAFIVERDTPGFNHGGEEHKLGLRGSSTAQLIFNDSPVPVENVLGEVGKGHKVAFNTLNLGRYKLAGGVLSVAKRALAEALQYSVDRKQFHTRVADFGTIREQITDSMVGIYLSESLVYRIAGYIDARLADVSADAPDYTDKTMAAIEEYAIEASIAKVYVSEALDRILDRALQWHGGYGFVEDYNIEKFVRDARVNRIFEGTNEINRLLVPGTAFKRAVQKRLGIYGAIQRSPAQAGVGPEEHPPVMQLSADSRQLSLLRHLITDPRNRKGGKDAQRRHDQEASSPAENRAKQTGNQETAANTKWYPGKEQADRSSLAALWGVSKNDVRSGGYQGRLASRNEGTCRQHGPEALRHSGQARKQAPD